MAYIIKVEGESESDFRGARPDNIDDLLKKPSKDVKSLVHKVVKAQVELAIQNGDTASAWEAIKKYEDAEFSYKAPLNRFQRDDQNGQCPYIGGHAVFGAFRDAAVWLSPGSFYQKGKQGQTGIPSNTHLRKFVIVRPNHIFMYKNQIIKTANSIEGQQPTVKVKGFGQYEVIYHPFHFKFNYSINESGPFEKLLKNKIKIEEIVFQAANHGLGACRSAGYGQWKITKLEFDN